MEVRHLQMNAGDLHSSVGGERMNERCACKASDYNNYNILLKPTLVINVDQSKLD